MPGAGLSIPPVLIAVYGDQLANVGSVAEDEDVTEEAAGTQQAGAEQEIAGPGPDDAVPVDELPADLQPHLVDPDEYVFPNNNRRRIPGYLYLAIALGLVALVLIRGGDAVLVNRGFLGAAAILGLFGVYSIITGWDLAVDERDALTASIAEVGFPVGHASAQMGWRGLLSRPTWRILLYSADEPPTKRAFVMVDGVEASIVDSFVEDNPEDWSDLVPADS